MEAMIAEMITAQSHPFVDLIHTYSFHPFVQYILICREFYQEKFTNVTLLENHNIFICETIFQ
jgi:hypothetical protein